MSTAARTPVHGRRAARRPRRSTWRPGPVPETFTVRRIPAVIGGLSVAVITISGWLSYLISSSGR